MVDSDLSFLDFPAYAGAGPEYQEIHTERSDLSSNGKTSIVYYRTLSFFVFRF
jgi:hypothetical protein